MDTIFVKGAREHNLKNIDVRIPRNALTVITGLSGSGKSSLAFDTLYAEGQRRYVESLSAYARQFLGLMEKPDVDYIEGLSPAISIEQKSTSRSPRSTVGTITEIYDYLRLLFARIGQPHCYQCGKKITQQTVQQIVDSVLALPVKSKIQVLAPVVRGRKGEYRELLKDLQKEGFVRVRVDGSIVELEKSTPLSKNVKHTIEIIIDRLVMDSTLRNRLTDSVELALKKGDGLITIHRENEKEMTFSQNFACIDCGISYEEMSPRMFSFNTPYGACSTCDGLGICIEIDPERVVPDPERSITDGAIAPWRDGIGAWYLSQIKPLTREFKINLSVPFKNLTPQQQKIILYGPAAVHHDNGFGYEGVIPNLLRRFKQTESDGMREWIEKFMSRRPCTDCQGKRLKKESLSVKIQNHNIAEICALSIKESQTFFKNLQLNERDKTIAKQILKEINERLDFLMNVGLAYLSLEREAGTLSGGEAQRIRLATQIGSQLVGVLYILDEPSIGLHQRDNQRLLNALQKLKNLGNTVIVVEHDRETIESADYIVDLGPGAGKNGGEVVAAGTPQIIGQNKKSLTGQFLTQIQSIPVPSQRRRGNGLALKIKGATGHNLKKIEVEFPLGTFICVTGVSGSGKSSLINETLYPALSNKLLRTRLEVLSYHSLSGLENIDKVIDIDQSPIGRTPRSNPATYTKLFGFIRDLFTALPESKMRGYRPGRFSFNVEGGRCETCSGDGIIKIEMNFLPDIYVTCESCKGKRYNRETLEIRYKGKSIAEILDMTVNEATDFFSNIPSLRNKLKTLQDVGLGYIHLGQQATTLSGGEAQRVKLAAELSKRSTGKTIYILDEPTTGLHFLDIKMLLQVLNNFVASGNTVIVIEHNIDVIKSADHIIDLGPEGGEEGGQVIATGTPEQVAQNSRSYTGHFLKKEFK